MSKESIVKITPLAMTVPNEGGVYSISKIMQSESLTLPEFNKRFRGYNKKIKIGNLNNWEYKTAFGYGLDCWYLAEFQ